MPGTRSRRWTWGQTNPEAKQDALEALAPSKVPAIQLQTFEWALTADVRAQDVNKLCPPGAQPCMRACRGSSATP